MADFVYRVSGTVTYSDNSWAPFEVSVQNGLIHSPYGNYSLEDFKQTYASTEANMSTEVDALLALFVGPAHSLTPDAPTTSKTVTDLNMEVSGTVANDDNTSQVFSAQYSFSNGYLIADEADGSAQLAYDKVVDTGAWNALITSAWEVLVGATKASITT